MKWLTWTLITCVGFGLMLWSYYHYQRIDESTPWAAGLMVLGEGEPAAPLPDGVQPAAAMVRLLGMGSIQRAMFKELSKSPKIARYWEVFIQEKLIVVPFEQIGITADLLASGRLPKEGAGEVLAGYRARHKDAITIEKRTLKVVGVLRRDVALMAQVYLAWPDESFSALLDPADKSVRPAALIRLKPQQQADRDLVKKLRAVYPSKEFTMVAPSVRVERGPFYLYMLGMALLLLGGSGLLIRLYRVLAARIPWRVLHWPLAEMRRRRRLLWGIHIAYFGLFIVAALVIYELPSVQALVLGQIQSEVSSQGSGPLAIAGKAYRSGIIPYAAGVTFAINFFLGSLGYITLPSMLIPGIGVLLAAVRAGLWGLLLAPSYLNLSKMMLPHSWTLLLEGEAYILATFFALLIPIYLFDTRLGVGVLRRFGRVLLLNLTGCVLIAIVLAVAAWYEAAEVIWMAGF